MSPGICRVADCTTPIKVIKESLCGRHYGRLRKHGDPEAWKKPRRPVCSVEGCEFRAAAHGLCDTHYRRQRRYGTTDAPPARPTVCAVPGCHDRVEAYSLCERHYRRHKQGSGDRHCVHCGQLLDPNIHGRAKYCNDNCKKKEDAVKRRETYRTIWLKRYGLTVEQFDAMLAGQGGRCAICRTDEKPKRGSWHVDHCHETGKVRGILCHGCNVALGHLHDRVDLLQSAIAYLERDNPLVGPATP